MSGDIRIDVNQSNVVTRVDVHPNQKKLTMEFTWEGQPSSTIQNVISTPETSAPASVPKKTETRDRNKEYTAEEVSKHNTEKDCWVIVNGQVLDVTKFLPDHPGGKKAIMIYAGREATEEFNMLHKPDVVEKYAADCIIGVFKGASTHPTSKL